jgi:hypothetical protein
MLFGINGDVGNYFAMADVLGRETRHPIPLGLKAGPELSGAWGVTRM